MNAYQPSRSHMKWVKNSKGQKVRNDAYVPPKKRRTTKPVDLRAVPDQGVLPDKESADISRLYGHAGIPIGHLHNSGSINELEAFYYSSRQGRVELARRMSQSSGSDYSELSAMLDNGYSPPTPRLPDDLSAKISRGRKQLESFVPEDEDYTYSRRGIDHSRDDVRHFLTEKSAEWMRSLTTEEQEAISRMTSNGFEVMKGELGISKSRWKDEVPIAAPVLSAMRKAPRFDKPVTIYRGTNSADISDGIRSRIPQSATTLPAMAMSFEDGVVLEISQVTAAVPGNVGAWGVKEEEVMTNPASDYVETGRRKIYPHESDPEYSVTIVSMKEIPRS